jgi:hypothetical protein
MSEEFLQGPWRSVHWHAETSLGTIEAMRSATVRLNVPMQWLRAANDSGDSRHAEVRRAASVDEVISLAVDYRASWTPWQLARIPEPYRPPRIRRPEDVEAMARVLAAEPAVFCGVRSDAALVQDFASFFLAAAVRMRELGR